MDIKHIPLETKEAIVKQALESNGKAIAKIAADNKIGYSALQKWLRAVRAGKLPRQNHINPIKTRNK